MVVGHLENWVKVGGRIFLLGNGLPLEMGKFFSPILIMVYPACFQFGGLCDTQLQKLFSAGLLLHAVSAYSDT